MKVYILYHIWRKTSIDVIGIFDSIEKVRDAEKEYKETEGWYDLDEEFLCKSYSLNISYPRWNAGGEVEV